ncbi:MAG: hypothetical protein HQ507_05220 [Candidatus Marinimicrobia bacterium]|nr:hypothetical protein [Candidatus Neomarinimicrobiota bacterium]
MTNYKHSQRGILLPYVLSFAALISIAMLLLMPAESAMLGVSVLLLVLLICLYLFRSLTVEITSDRLTVWFGSGLIRKSIPLEDIIDARIVRNPWFYGWGIRFIPHGWMFNVSGFDAVELELKNKRKFRVGSDEANELVTALRRRI